MSSPSGGHALGALTCQHPQVTNGTAKANTQSCEIALRAQTLSACRSVSPCVVERRRGSKSRTGEKPGSEGELVRSCAFKVVRVQTTGWAKQAAAGVSFVNAGKSSPDGPVTSGASGRPGQGPSPMFRHMAMWHSREAWLVSPATPRLNLQLSGLPPPPGISFTLKPDLPRLKPTQVEAPLGAFHSPRMPRFSP